MGFYILALGLLTGTITALVAGGVGLRVGRALRSRRPSWPVPPGPLAGALGVAGFMVGMLCVGIAALLVDPGSPPAPVSPLRPTVTGCLALVRGEQRPDDVELGWAIFDAPGGRRVRWDPGPTERGVVAGSQLGWVQETALYREAGEERAFALLYSVPLPTGDLAGVVQDTTIGAAWLAQRPDGWCLRGLNRALTRQRMDIESKQLARTLLAPERSAFLASVESGRLGGGDSTMVLLPTETSISLALSFARTELRAPRDGRPGQTHRLDLSAQPGEDGWRIVVTDRVRLDDASDTAGVAVEARVYALQGDRLVQSTVIPLAQVSGRPATPIESPGMRVSFIGELGDRLGFDVYHLCADGRAQAGLELGGRTGSYFGTWTRVGNRVNLRWETVLRTETRRGVQTEVVDHHPRPATARLALDGAVGQTPDLSVFEGDCPPPDDRPFPLAGRFPEGSWRPLGEADLAHRSRAELRQMRYEINARSQGDPIIFDSPEGQSEGAETWFTAHPLTPTERENLARIEAAIEEAPPDPPPERI